MSDEEKLLRVWLMEGRLDREMRADDCNKRLQRVQAGALRNAIMKLRTVHLDAARVYAETLRSMGGAHG